MSGSVTLFGSSVATAPGEITVVRTKTGVLIVGGIAHENGYINSAIIVFS